jgi:hypothetical protein
MRVGGFTVALALAALVHLGAAGDPRIPRTADGRPDLSGFWTNDSFTPLERAPELGDKEFFTPQEAAAYLKQRLDRLNGQSKDDIHYDDALWQAETYSKQANLRTSIVFDPPNGRLPSLTPEAQRRDTSRVAMARVPGPPDSAQVRSLAERCISWGNVGPPMLPPTYNANFEIMQAPGMVVLRHEMMHDTRLVYTDGRPHAAGGSHLDGRRCARRWEGTRSSSTPTNFTTARTSEGRRRRRVRTSSRATPCT